MEKIVSDDFLKKIASHSPECQCSLCRKAQDQLNEDMQEEMESRRKDYEVDRHDAYQHRDTE